MATPSLSPNRALEKLRQHRQAVRGRYMITRLDLGMSTPHPAIGIEAIGAAATGSSGARYLNGDLTDSTL